MNTIILKNPFSFPKALNYHITIVDGNDNNKFLVVMELWRIEKPEFISLLVAVYVQGIFVEYHIPDIVLINLSVLGSFKAVAGKYQFISAQTLKNPINITYGVFLVCHIITNNNCISKNIKLSKGIWFKNKIHPNLPIPVLLNNLEKGY